MYVLPVSITLTCLSTIAVALRLFIRIRLVCAPGWDDWFLLFAQITDYAFFGLLLAEHAFGLGKPQASLTPDEFRMQLKMLWMSVPLYNLSLTLTKISMVLLYMRLFPTKTYKIISTVLLVLIVCSGIWMVLGTVLICIPIHAFWDQDIEHTCLSRAAVWYTNAALQITGNLVLVALPMPQLIRLQIPLRQKLCLIFIFALGLFVCATGVARVYALYRFLTTTDYSQNNAFIATWSFIESSVAILCVSLPVFRQLYVHIVPRKLRTLPRVSHKPAKHFHGPGFSWEPFQGSASYSAGVSVDADRDSNSAFGDGIQVMRELRWEVGSAASGRDNGPPVYSTDPIDQANSDRISSIHFE
ncbi:hypothetical protein BJX61DRAFT_417835 [Aspergillus egyptiacus]|nr:hypothetical protein BJX61DRAFT_417835 [Aspergillus egyptiacus]